MMQSPHHASHRSLPQHRAPTGVPHRPRRPAGPHERQTRLARAGFDAACGLELGAPLADTASIYHAEVRPVRLGCHRHSVRCRRAPPSQVRFPPVLQADHQHDSPGNTGRLRTSSPMVTARARLRRNRRSSSSPGAAAPTGALWPASAWMNRERGAESCENCAVLLCQYMGSDARACQSYQSQGRPRCAGVHG